MSWIGRQAEQAAWTAVGAVAGILAPGVVAVWVPALRERVAFVERWMLASAAIAFAALLILLARSRLALRARGPLKVFVCSYCQKVIGPREQYVVVPHAPSEVAHPACYAPGPF